MRGSAMVSGVERKDRPAERSPLWRTSNLRRWTLWILAGGLVLTTALVIRLWDALGLSFLEEWGEAALFLATFWSPYLGLGLAVLILARGRAATLVLLAAAVLVPLWGLALTGVALVDGSDLAQLVLPLAAVFHQWIGVFAAAAVAWLVRWLSGRRPGREGSRPTRV